MSMRERTGVRDLLYSQWHRADRTRRFLGPVRAVKLTAIDIDWCETCCWCSEPLALVETQESRHTKSAVITTALGRRAGLPVFSVGYTANADRTDITEFSVREIWPNQGLETVLTPLDYALWLEGLRTAHFAGRAQGGGLCNTVDRVS